MNIVQQQQSPLVQKVEWAWSDSPILLPVAFEPREWNAVYVAFFMAEYSGSEVILAHVDTVLDAQPKIDYFISELEKFSKTLRVRYKISRTKVKRNDPKAEEIAEELVRQAEQNDCQAIVMSAHREAFFTEVFGRVSDRVARRSSRTVLLVETPYAGLGIPKNPRRILIPVLRSDFRPDAFIVASALTSSASVPDVEITVAKIVELPSTTPLDAIESSMLLRKEEQEFSIQISTYIKSLGRLFNPKVIAVRDVGSEVSSFARENGADLIIMTGGKPTGYGLMASQKYDIVAKAPCVVLVLFPKQ
jgi:nucleotide-binding universal stress UspA family protein